MGEEKNTNGDKKILWNNSLGFIHKRLVTARYVLCACSHFAVFFPFLTSLSQYNLQNGMSSRFFFVSLFIDFYFYELHSNLLREFIIFNYTQATKKIWSMRNWVIFVDGSMVFNCQVQKEIVARYLFRHFCEFFFWSSPFEVLNNEVNRWIQ